MVRLTLVTALLAAWSLASPGATAQVAAAVLLAAVAAAGLCLATVPLPAVAGVPASRGRGRRPVPVLVRVDDPATPGRPQPRAPGGVPPVRR
jgi:hypothetical protein